MGIFSRNKEKSKLVLVFDIGSSSVGGTLFYMEKSRIPKIIMSLREPIILQKTLNIDKFLSSTAKSLDIVVNKIYKAGIGKPEAIFCVLSSPWHVSQIRVIRLEKNTPFIFTTKLADDLIQKEIALFKEEYLAKYLHTESPVRLIEFKNIKTMLNGYETLSPLEQKTKEFEMTIFISVSSEYILKKIEETIRKYFHFKNVKFSSFTLSSFAVARDIDINQKNFLLIDIGGEVTDISMIKKNALHESISFPLGRNFIVRKVASALSCSLSEAQSYISLLQDGHATDFMTKKLKPVINKFQLEWLYEFQKSLANLSSDIFIPATIYLTTDKDLLDFFRQTIEAEQFNQYTLTESKFKVIFLSAEVFRNMVVFGNGVIRDPSLIIDSIYINRFLTDSVLSERV
ncbi:hypothetical protein A2641_03595 [Candidatus Nomurabacteria bacterium RIFCSPHIGHO2_01_FULL_37_25]|uniref:SHS2 domain-containing protein n=1 Tax=Candidatus Nomurabacteria bacterium RIFCSPLOWO2_01_FULL_36_16 TaxID=1801767 RepID=A0A1F6WY03_9BACT|nr:MAG: hypothetical protein A2641_03595 [Candidatus Nomurabacteria bacterium RIFCSPHIGHO2_01_FULL_37_25]OGI75121.1 MAG: hypothetical protein A3D36_00750 [Candidatus Nomurabacteria bacterium RIFCSPHIGHO2_02_FULL_36_29]OGI86776.1 MAG: hypothetical protein A3A91_00960 [Candidatus Nomurabacteria bacterium RIFCSPLOWO2_01_FULL_36_16]OGI96450.1 MAG: hypothetical protein A3I84_00435 [Candidatus Nomurabacteria bacterium RIFCSPLOWO2_02_FULL_36_8]